MTSTTSMPAVRYGARDGRPRLRRADLRQAGQRDTDLTELSNRRLGAGDKLSVPQPSLPLLNRARVTELFRRAAARRVTLICAPSGAGKTVACALWAASAAQAGNVAWLSLDHGDRTRHRLWAHIRSALVSSLAMPADIASELPAPADSAFGVQLAEATQRLPDPVTLILDDISVLAGAGVLPGLDQLIRSGPATLRLVLAGRHPAGLQVARLRVGGDLAEIGAQDLACTAEEAQDYFAMLGIDLPAPQRDELLRRTEGWMTGLRLAAMRAEPGKTASAVSRITGEEPAVADYLWDEVLAGLPAERRLFLLRTSVADVICGDLADALTGAGNGSTVLDQLHRENMMVSPAADTASTSDTIAYRYHPLLLELLRAQLRSELPGEIGQLTRRAARWQASRGLHADAIRSAARAGDWDFAARVLAVAGPGMLLPTTAAELEPIIAAFPASRFVSDASVAGALAAAGIRTGDYRAAALHLDNAASALGRCASAQRRVVTPWLQCLRLMSAVAQEQADTALIEQSQAAAVQAEATAVTAAEHLGLGLLWYALGMAALTASEIADARERFSRSVRHLQAGGHREFENRAQAWHALSEALYGDLHLAAEMIAGQSARAAGNPDPLCARLADLTSAQGHWSADEPAAAYRALGASEPAERTAGQPVEPAMARLLGTLETMARARLALGEGDQGAARTLLTRLRYQCLNAGHGLHQGNGIAPGGTTALDLLLAPLDVDIALRDGDLSRAKHALARVGCGPEPAGHPHLRPELVLARARLLLAQDDSQGVLSTIDPCLHGPAAQVTLYDHVRALVMAAIACRRLGQADEAAEQLTRAMALAEPQGMFRPFLDGGAAARSVLTVLIRPTSQGAAFAARIAQRFDTAPSGPVSQAQAACAPLTSSELAVLRLLPSHMTNQEIAEALFLSINTVKTHLRSVYRKLSVTTRRQAISRGGRLGLL